MGILALVEPVCPHFEAAKMMGAVFLRYNHPNKGVFQQTPREIVVATMPG
jgi:hypothetical protein